MVHQHFMLADVFTVMENVVVGAEPSKKQIINKNHIISGVGFNLLASGITTLLLQSIWGN